MLVHFLEFYRIIPNLHVDENTKLITIKIISLKENVINVDSRLLIHFLLKFIAYAYQWICLILHSTKSMNTLLLVFLLHNLFSINVYQNCLSLFLYDCVDCQVQKYESLKQNKAEFLPISKLSTFLNCPLNCPLNSASDGNHNIYVFDDLFSKYIVTVPTPKDNAIYAVIANDHHWFSKHGPSQYLIRDAGTEYPTSEMTNCCTLFNIRHSARTSHAPWTSELVEVQNKVLGNHLRNFLHDTPENWSIRVISFAYARKAQFLSYLQIPPFETVFVQNRVSHWIVNQIVLEVHLWMYCAILHQIASSISLSINWFKSLFHGYILKPISIWFLAIETAILEIIWKMNE